MKRSPSAVPAGPCGSSSHATSQTGRDDVLIFNFFSGVLQRGIPSYVQNLRVGLEQQGIRSREVCCPASLRRLPRPLLDMLFAIWEQLVIPLQGLRYHRVIHPYNSVSVLGSLAGKSVLVVHDLIPYSRRHSQLSFHYIRGTQCVHALLGRDVAFISRLTEKAARRAGLFPRSRTFVFPNAFFRFMQELRPADGSRSEDVLLCTGWGANKDLLGALKIYRASGLWMKRKLKILGLSGDAEAIDAFCSSHKEMADRITVLPRLDGAEVGEAYRCAAWVWVHSRQEGYGRSIAEAKICACRIVASDIPPFREQKDSEVFLYSGLNSFLDAWSRCEAAEIGGVPREPEEHAFLHQEIARFLKANRLDRHSRRATEASE